MINLPLVDWIVIIFLSYFAIKAIKKEFVIQLISVVGWGATYYTVPNYEYIIAKNQWFNFLSIDYQEIACKATIFCVTVILFDLIATIAGTSTGNKQRHSILINILGMFMGLLKGSILIAFIISLLNMKNINIDALAPSKIIPIVQQLSDIIHGYVERILHKI